MDFAGHSAGIFLFAGISPFLLRFVFREISIASCFVARRVSLSSGSIAGGGDMFPSMTLHVWWQPTSPDHLSSASPFSRPFSSLFQSRSQ